MTLTISLPTETEAELRQRASASGTDVTQFVEQLIARELSAPISLADAAEPLARAVDAAELSDSEFLTILNDARDASRRERRGNAL